MKKSTYSNSLDIHSTKVQTSFNAIKGDTKREIRFVLTEKNKPYKIASSCTARFDAKLPGNAAIHTPATIEGNEIVVELSNVVTSAAGIVQCEVTLLGAENERITSPKFNIVVEGGLNSEE